MPLIILYGGGAQAAGIDCAPHNGVSALQYYGPAERAGDLHIKKKRRSARGRATFGMCVSVVLSLSGADRCRREKEKKKGLRFCAPTFFSGRLLPLILYKGVICTARAVVPFSVSLSLLSVGKRNVLLGILPP
jgi:hypothetical protein